jgi:hypothetical protein
LAASLFCATQTEEKPRRKEMSEHLKILLNRKMAGVTRLELATSCVTGKRSNQLSYTPKYDGKFWKKTSDFFINLPAMKLGKKASL